jgi:RNA polymerase sigma-70 factor, ECF subfamily
VLERRKSILAPRTSSAELPNQFENITEQQKEEIIDELMELYSEKVYLLAYSYVKDKGMAEDISQEVFIKCFKSLQYFRGDSKISSWIYRITANTAKDFLRSKSFNLFKYPISFFENLTKNDTPVDALIKKDEKELVLQTVLNLPTKYREIIILYYFQDEKQEVIAEILNLNLNTVKTRLSRARALLKEKLTSFTGADLIGKRS